MLLRCLLLLSVAAASGNPFQQALSDAKARVDATIERVTGGAGPGVKIGNRQVKGLIDRDDIAFPKPKRKEETTGSPFSNFIIKMFVDGPAARIEARRKATGKVERNPYVERLRAKRGLGPIKVSEEAAVAPSASGEGRGVQAGFRTLAALTLKVALPVAAGSFLCIKVLEYLRNRKPKSPGSGGRVVPAARAPPVSAAASVSAPAAKSSPESAPPKALPKGESARRPGSDVALEELLRSTKKMANGAAVDSPTLPSGSAYTVLLFDCDEKLTSAADMGARLEYFQAMANLTGGASFRTVYVPSSGNGNPHIVERNESFRPDWTYVAGSLEGKRTSGAIRERLGVGPAELRIVLLGGALEVISDDAAELLRFAPVGAAWVPAAFREALGTEFVSPDRPANETVSIDLAGKRTALYFSASWCKPCQMFTPKLVELYANLTSKDPQLELVFVSLDQDEEAFEQYRRKMKWPAVPFRDIRRALLQVGMHVKSIPALVFVDEQGRVMTSSGVTAVMSDPTLRTYPFRDTVMDLNVGMNAERLQRSVSLIAFTEGCAPGVQAVARGALGDLLSANAAPLVFPRSHRNDVFYSCAEAPSKLSQVLRTLCSLPPASVNIVYIVLLDLTAEEYYQVGLTVDADVSDADLASKIKEACNGLVKGYQSYDVKLQKMAKLPAEPEAEEELLEPPSPEESLE